MKHVIYYLLIVLLLYSCKDKSPAPQERGFPLVKDVNTLPNTDFVPTLETNMFGDQNNIYCATSLFAWDKLRQELGQPIISEIYKDLIAFDTSVSFKNVLSPDEYKTTYTNGGGQVTFRSEFQKELPFETPLELKDPITFAGQRVETFGLDGSDKFDQLRQLDILMYEEDQFIIKLQPKDQDHEIYLFMPNKSYKTMAELVSEINKYQNHRHDFIEGSKLVIPKFKYNLEKDYKQFRGNEIKIPNMEKVEINLFYQRNAFLIDEAGAKAESEAEIGWATSPGPGGEVEVKKPKIMIYDKPFFLMLKRKDTSNPYFAMWIDNAELMSK